MNAENPVRANIASIARLEHEFLERRNLADRMGDAVVTVIGSPGFVAGHAVGFLLWIAANLGMLPGVPMFDPYPFILLAMVMSMEGVLLAIFILMKQNRTSRRADQRDHLHLQVNLLAEREITKMLQLQRLICERLGIPEAVADREVAQLAENTAVETLARETNDKLPE